MHLEKTRKARHTGNALQQKQRMATTEKQNGTGTTQFKIPSYTSMAVMGPRNSGKSNAKFSIVHDVVRVTQRIRFI